MNDFENEFAVFILTHGRADNVKTVKTLERCGYTGKYYIVIDNEDDQEERYREIYGDKVMQFDKREQAEKTDYADNHSEDRRSVVFARNYCFELAKKLNVKYFCELDDDYTNFEYRYIEENKLKIKSVQDLDTVFRLLVDFLEESGALTVAMAQGGDFIGGANSGTYKKGLLRKAMNSFVCSTDRPFEFYGRINEDTTAYCVYGMRGKLMFTITAVSLVQTQTQKNAGGWTEVYLERGTYVKSFYSVIFEPSCVSIRVMGDKHMRIHHNVAWNNCVPCIIDEKYKKD